MRGLGFKNRMGMFIADAINDTVHPVRGETFIARELTIPLPAIRPELNLTGKLQTERRLAKRATQQITNVIIGFVRQ